MASLTTSAEILDWVLFQAGEQIDGTSDFHTHAIDCLNRAYRDIWMGGGALVEGFNEAWLWLRKDPPGVLTLNPVIETGTVSVTNNSASATLSAVQATSLAGRFFKVESHPDIFRISAHTAGTDALTLDSVYTGTTDSDANYKAMQLEYSLASDVLRPLAPMRVYKDNKQEIDGVDIQSLERDYPLALVKSGTPELFALIGEQKVRFNRYGGISSTELIRVEYDYLRKPSTELGDNSVEPLVPLEHRQVLADTTLFYLLIAKSDSKADGFGKMAQAGLRAMAIDNRARMVQISRRMGKIMPRADKVRRYDRVLRTSSGHILG